jgi:hypothetical protein
MDHGFPVIRIEIEGMKQSILHAIMERQLMMDEWVTEAVERELSDDRIKAMIEREVQRTIENTVREEVDKFYRLGKGRGLVASIVQSRLDP